MVGIDQINIRVPDPAKSAVKKVARLLREDATFIDRLTRFLDDDEVMSQGLSVVDRLERLEACVADLMGRVDHVASSTADMPAQLDLLARFKTFREGVVPSRPERPVAWSMSTASRRWTSGAGRGRRLTPEGETEMRRRIAEGQSDRQIAKAFDVRPFTVRNHRKRIALAVEKGL